MVSSELQQRAFSAVILIIIALCGLVGGQWWAVLVLSALGLLAMQEWLVMLKPPQLAVMQGLGFAAVVLALLAVVWASAFLGAILVLLMMVGVFLNALGSLRVGDNNGNLRQQRARAAWLAAGVPYIAGGVLAILTLRQLPEVGMGLTLYLLLVVWGTDIGAYFVGRWAQGPKLLPQVSPSKTWSGLFGGIATAGLLGYACALGFHARTPWAAFGLAAWLAIVAQAGDLFESFVKRRCGVKDSGRIIPGHGGVLDRIDGLLAAAIFLALFQAQWGDRLQWW